MTVYCDQTMPNQHAVARAIKTLRRKLQSEGVLGDLRSHSHALSPGERRRAKAGRARSRAFRLARRRERSR